MKWELYKRSFIPLHRVTPFLYGVQKRTHELIGCEPVICVSAHEGHKFWWAWDYDQIREIGKKLIADIKEDYEKHFEIANRLLQQAFEYSEKIRKMKFRNLSDVEFIRLYEDYLNKIIDTHAFLGVTVDAIDIYPFEYFKNLVYKFLDGKVDDVDGIFQKLNRPTFLSYIKQAERDLLEKDIDYVVDKWWWISLGWENMKPMTKDEFIQQKKDMDKNDFSFADENKTLKEEIIKKYGFNDEIKFFIRLFEDYSVLHDKRKEMQVKTVYGLHLFLNDAERRLGVNGLQYYFADEVIEFLRGKKVENLKARKDASLIYIRDASMEKYFGAEAIERRKVLLSSYSSDIDEIKGMPTYSGRLIGRAKVCFGAKDAFEKVEEGDILICSMTLPDYLPAIKKAGAILTDEGGITCHAAIISRELKKPCIVGTINATDVFKDGDLLEFDSTTGVVKKVK